MGNPIPPILIFPSDAAGAGSRNGCRLKGTWVLGVNWFETDLKKRHPGLCEVEFDGKKWPGRCYCSKSGGITDEILEAIIEDIFAPMFPNRSAENPVIILADGHSTRFALNVLRKAKELHFRIVMGVPNATHLWQVPDIYNNGVFKMLWVNVKTWWVQQKMLDDLKKVPESEKTKISFSDIVILFNKIFPKSFGDAEKNRKAFAKCGILPFTRCLLENEVVVKNSCLGAEELSRNTDRAISEAGDLIPSENLEVFYRTREALLHVRKRNSEQHGILLEDQTVSDSVAHTEEEKSLINTTRHTAGGFFRAGEIEMTGDAVFNCVLERNEAKNKKADEDAEKRARKERQREEARIANEEKEALKKKKEEEKSLKDRLNADVAAQASQPGSSKKSYKKVSEEYALKCHYLQDEIAELKKKLIAMEVRARVAEDELAKVRGEPNIL